jgi:hypothetical protein
MPRLTHINPSYRKHRASGQGVVTIGGTDFYLGPWKSTSEATLPLLSHVVPAKSLAVKINLLMAYAYEFSSPLI